MRRVRRLIGASTLAGSRVTRCNTRADGYFMLSRSFIYAAMPGNAEACSPDALFAHPGSTRISLRSIRATGCYPCRPIAITASSVRLPSMSQNLWNSGPSR